MDEGAGAKWFAYAGAVKMLEGLGLLGKIQRFTRVGIGAIVGAVLAVAYDCDQMQISLKKDSENIILDDQEDYAYPFPKFLETFGWNNGEVLHVFNLMCEHMTHSATKFLSIFFN